MVKNYEGLKEDEVLNLRSKYGYNEIIFKNDHHILKLILSQFTSFLVIILLIAGILSIILGDILDGIAIFAIIILNAIIGFFQEFKAENAVKALKKMLLPKTIVIREGIEKEIFSKELVPGDVILLVEGDKVPADSIILEAFALKIDESILTGESKTVSKLEGEIYSGTLISTGKVYAKVVKIGNKTKFGEIVNLLSKESKTETLLTKEVNKLAKNLGIIIIILISILIIIELFGNLDFYNTIMTAIALGVSAIPEGLPIIVTLTLALGTQTLAKKKAIVRKMSAIETLGATTVICSDKTGTLTLNEMTVKKVRTLNSEFDIPGFGYTWDEKLNILNDETKPLLEVCENCNDSKLGKNIIGDPTEIALKVLTRKTDYVKKLQQVNELPFSSERKIMSTLNKIDNKIFLYSKGAFEEIIKKCSFILDDGKIRAIKKTDIEEFKKIHDRFSNEALRVLAFAYQKDLKEIKEDNLIFIGLVGMLDPPRPDVFESLNLAKGAGIKVKIITGDNALTAKAIAKKIGFKNLNIVLGSDIDKMNDDQLKKIILTTDIYARTNPEHKYRLVSILQSLGEVVAVTGDGVNDAPAIKKGDVGIAMGIKGTEATREVADIVLKDDNFGTIVSAIKEGRRIYHNILLFVKYMLSANFGILVFVGLLSLLRLPLPFLALQILWINIVTDSLPALALGQQKAQENIMQNKPRDRKVNMLKQFKSFIIIALILYIIVCFVVFMYGYKIDLVNGINLFDLDIPSKARTLVFCEIVILELFLTFVCVYDHSQKFFANIKEIITNKLLIISILFSFVLQLLVVYIPFLQMIFKTTPLNLIDWLLIFGTSCIVFLIPFFETIFNKIEMCFLKKFNFNLKKY